MSDKALLKTDQHMAPWGGKDAVNDMAQRLLMSMPGARKMEPPQAKALAQIAVAHGLDPFNGEVWFIPGSGVMVGIKGLRKAARRQLQKDIGSDASFWTDFKRVVDPKDYGATDDDLVFEYRLRDTASLDSWGRVVKKFRELGFELDEASAHAGPAPIIVGVGIYKKGEATKMQPNEVARKRAEANAIKQRFDVEFAFEVDIDHDVIEADFAIVDEPKQPPRTEDEINQELGYDVEKPTRPYTPAELKEAMGKMIKIAKGKQQRVTGTDRKVAAAQLNTLFGGDDKRHLATKYLVGAESTTKMGSEKIASLLRWAGVENFVDVPDAVIIEEANTLVKELAEVQK